MSNKSQNNNDEEPEPVIPIPVLRRIAKDVSDVMNSDLEKYGIYYQHSSTDVRNGYALIRGSPDGAYECGLFPFMLQFPNNYPASPPKVTFLMNYSRINTHTRFHPNLYTNGKVCLSILGTWPGESWTSCLSLQTVLVSIQSLFDGEPLLNEPAINIDNCKSLVKKYRLMVQHASIESGCLDLESTLKHLNITKKFPVELICKIEKTYLERLYKSLEISKINNDINFSYSDLIYKSCHKEVDFYQLMIAIQRKIEIEEKLINKE